MPQVQESQEKLKKWQKSGKNRVFEIKVRKFDKIWKKSDFVSSNLQNSLFPKPNGKKVIQNRLKSD